MQKLVTYFNNGSTPLVNVKDLLYTNIILAFLFTEEKAPLELNIAGGMAASQSPPELTHTTINAIKELQQVGKKVHVSFGGGTMTSKAYAGMVGSESKIAQSIADFVIKYDLDGVDIDFEDTAAFMGKARYNGVDLLVNLTKALRSLLPAGKYMITHAPQPPYLVPGNGMDGYVEIMKNVGDQIDWLNVQFYNNPPWSTSPKEIVNAVHQFSLLQNLSTEKIMVGLPVTIHDAATGYIPINEIVSSIVNPLMQQDSIGGMMNWQFSSDKDGEWGKTIGNALGLSANLP